MDAVLYQPLVPRKRWPNKAVMPSPTSDGGVLSDGLSQTPRSPLSCRTNEASPPVTAAGSPPVFTRAERRKQACRSRHTSLSDSDAVAYVGVYPRNIARVAALAMLNGCGPFECPRWESQYGEEIRTRKEQLLGCTSRSLYAHDPPPPPAPARECARECARVGMVERSLQASV